MRAGPGGHPPGAQGPSPTIHTVQDRMSKYAILVAGSWIKLVDIMVIPMTLYWSVASSSGMPAMDEGWLLSVSSPLRLYTISAKPGGGHEDLLLNEHPQVGMFGLSSISVVLVCQVSVWLVTGIPLGWAKTS